jgi:hypothetical protein
LGDKKVKFINFARENEDKDLSVTATSCHWEKMLVLKGAQGLGSGVCDGECALRADGCLLGSPYLLVYWHQISEVLCLVWQRFTSSCDHTDKTQTREEDFPVWLKDLVFPVWGPERESENNVIWDPWISDCHEHLLVQLSTERQYSGDSYFREQGFYSNKFTFSYGS